eukprot:TRINITY_DN12135_c0_g1_i1.p1 TRINITY_DN12135_c0_g1~~TRINITY_DN12135_c0_g1_i1.p1  ORF type:complete len:204 (+),score=40.48 TRINITY_DN12135_c0_g1_i1:95-706(+)
MFVLADIKDAVKVMPDELPPKNELMKTVTEKICDKYSNKILPNVGLCISMYDIVEFGDPIIYPSHGYAYVKIHMRWIVFRPFVGEIIVGRVKSCELNGVRVTLGFTDDVFIPADDLKSPSTYDEEEKLWVWNFQGHKLFMDVDEPVRLRVDQVKFLKPPASTRPSIKPDAPKDTRIEQKQGVPMEIIASIRDDGLGLTAWWNS